MATQHTNSVRSFCSKIIFLLGLAILLIACNTTETAVQCPDVECPEIITTPKPVLYENLWAASAHADKNSDAFTYWDNDEPPEIPADCAKCHSWIGFIDFLGVDSSTQGKVDNPVKVGTTITCYACHNEVSLDLNKAEFPSGITVRGLGAEARCILCHQGLASKKTVDDTISDLGLTNEDTPSTEIEFINSHSISGATPFGTEVQGAYEYNGQTYAGRFTRGDEFFSCIQCHDQHTLKLKFENCSECHTINGTESKDIRVKTNDFDGDGDNQEGIFYEIESLHSALLSGIQNYASDVIGNPISYDPDTYPYFFNDSNNNGLIDPDEVLYENRYLSWTPRLLRAAYNYNYVSRDPGAYAHNSTYILQILYDSLVDINAETTRFTRP